MARKTYAAMARGAYTLATATRLLIALVACAFVGVFAFTPLAAAHAVSIHPTLTVHATISDQKIESTGMESLLPAGMRPAGEGYIFSLQELDPAKVQQAGQRAQTSEQWSAAVLTHPSNYILARGITAYGVTDANGTVATAASTASSARQGIWLNGARYSSSSHAVTGGTPLQFNGTEHNPQFWLITLAYGPNKAEDFEPGVVQLPYQSSEGWNWDVVIYPKVKPGSPQPPEPNVPTNPNNPKPTQPSKGKPSVTPQTPAQKVVGVLSKTGSFVTLALILLAILMVIAAILTTIERIQRHRMEANTELTTQQQAQGRKEQR